MSFLIWTEGCWNVSLCLMFIICFTLRLWKVMWHVVSNWQLINKILMSDRWVLLQTVWPDCNCVYMLEELVYLTSCIYMVRLQLDGIIFPRSWNHLGVWLSVFVTMLSNNLNNITDRHNLSFNIKYYTQACVIYTTMSLIQNFDKWLKQSLW